MTTSRTPKLFDIPLDCGHKLLLEAPCPNINTPIWCIKCEDYILTAPSEGTYMVSHYGTWISRPLSSIKFQGECVECGHLETHRNWYLMRDKIERHILKAHSKFVTYEAEIPARLPKEAPF